MMIRFRAVLRFPLPLSLTVLLCLTIFSRCGAQNRDRITAPFIDVPEHHWAFDAVLDLRQSGIFLGEPVKGRSPGGLSRAVKHSRYDRTTPTRCWKSFVSALTNNDEVGLSSLVDFTVAGYRDSGLLHLIALGSDVFRSKVDAAHGRSLGRLRIENNDTPGRVGDYIWLAVGTHGAAVQMARLADGWVLVSYQFSF